MYMLSDNQYLLVTVYRLPVLRMRSATAFYGDLHCIYRLRDRILLVLTAELYDI
jgi:hypothetical protein